MSSANRMMTHREGAGNVTTAATASEAKLLEELNADLPEGVDWKQGAIEYLRNLVRSEGSRNELYHLIKPYLGGPDFQPFFSEMYGFLNMLEKSALPMKASVLDVACGPGWTAHYLAKLGHSVQGIDLSEDLLALARRRIAEEPYGAYEGIPLRAQFAVHDIEATALPADPRYDAAFFESALHHFVDPVQALRNVTPSLKEGGIICIWEAAAPQRGTAPYLQNIELMRKYRTLERPYTRTQIVRILELAGYVHFEFFAQVNGFFNIGDTGDRRRLQQQVRSADHWNIVIASRTAHFFVANDRHGALAGKRSAGGGADRGAADGIDWSGRELLAEGLRYLRRRLRGLAGRGRRVREDKVRAAYMAILGREPDDSGLAHYVAELESGKSLREMRTSLMESDEYRARGQSGT
jgi:SAM-dependent methyltransferase